jgi:hypothetical protein
MRVSRTRGRCEPGHSLESARPLFFFRSLSTPTMLRNRSAAAADSAAVIRLSILKSLCYLPSRPATHELSTGLWLPWPSIWGQTGGMSDALKMAAESIETTRAVAAKPTRNGRRARVSIDKRFVIGRRYAQLTATFRARVGPDVDQDPVLLAAVEKAARLTALAEDAAARALRADPKVTLDDVVRLTRLADLSVRRLRLDQRNATPQPSLSDYLRVRGEGGAA